MSKIAQTLGEYLDDIDVIMAITGGKECGQDEDGLYRYVVTLVNVVCHGHAVAGDFKIKSPKRLTIPLSEESKQFIMVYILSKVLFCNALFRMSRKTKYKKSRKLLNSWLDEYAETVESYCKIFTLKETMALKEYLNKDMLEKYVRQEVTSKVGKMFCK